MKTILPAGLLFFLIVGTLRAEVVLAPLFADGVVLQREQPHPVWGRATPGERVVVGFSGQTQTAITDRDGRWRVTLMPLAASAKPATLTVVGNNKVQVKDVLVGDVWLCSGQSNMEWAVSTALHPKEEAAKANFPLIRHCKVVRTVAENPAETVTASWQACSPATVLRFSAVGYYFARDQLLHSGVPIGIVTSAWGGTQIESWLSEPALKSDPDFAVVFSRWEQLLSDYPAAEAKQNAVIASWQQEADAAKMAGKPFTRRKPMAAEGPGSRWLPGGLYNGMIHPLVPFPFRGVLWYQGEANEFRASEYGKLFRAMILQWREAFDRDDLPFYFVQLANFATANDPSGQTWAFLREAQAQALALPHTGMVVTVDIGEDRDIHYKNKQEVGRRLSLLARAHLQGGKVDFSGPMMTEARAEGKTMRVTFTHATGLTSRQQPLVGFEIAGADRQFHPAVAKIEGEALLVSAPTVDLPVAVRYAWRNTPEIGLFNAAGLPAAPFRSDHWPATNHP